MSSSHRPVRYHTAPKPKPSSRKNKAAKKRAPASGGRPEDSSLGLWITLAVAVFVIALTGLYVGWPQLMVYLHSAPSAPAPVVQAPSLPLPTAPKIKTLTPEQERLAQIQDRVRQETLHEVERPVASTPAPAPKPPVVIPPTPIPPSPLVTLPPPVLVQPPAQVLPPPTPVVSTPAVPISKPVPTEVPRALPLDPNKLTTERIAAYQVALERQHFSCGFIDGDVGMRTQRMLRSYQASHGLPQTGQLDPSTRNAIGEPGDPFLTYTVTQQDLDSLMLKPPSWREKAQAKRLGYSDAWEMYGEKFHCARAYLKLLNPGLTNFTPGVALIGPKVSPAAPLGKATSLRVNLGETSIEPLDASGKPIAFFPCSIAADKNKRPSGELRVISVVPNPDYLFDPALFKDAAANEGITHKMVIPPGPRNPVGTAWIGLSLPGYGMHGTPEPENISRTQSHGCFRLANWNAEKLLKMVKVGTLVDVEP